MTRPDAITHGISYRNDVRDPTRFNGMFAVPGDANWRICRNGAGEIVAFETAAEAEANAGHRLVVFIDNVNQR